MRRTLALLFLFTGIAAADNNWNILNYIKPTNKPALAVTSDSNDDRSSNVQNYCESWRVNVELNNIRGYDVVPQECTEYIGRYMTNKQYKVDVHRAAEEVIFFLTNNFYLSGDAKDAWIFDIDDVLLSTVSLYKNYHYGGKKMEKEKYEKWVQKAKASAVDSMVKLFHELRARGLKVIIISSRPEHLREPTIDNLVRAGYHGWTRLILRCPEDNQATVEEYKAEQRGKLVQEGYRLWGIVGSQWSSLGGYSTARRIFKLPNPMYYVY